MAQAPHSHSQLESLLPATAIARVFTVDVRTNNISVAQIDTTVVVEYLLGEIFLRTISERVGEVVFCARISDLESNVLRKLGYSASARATSSFLR